MIPMTQAEALALTKKLLPKLEGAVFKNRMRPKPKRYQVGVMRSHKDGREFLALGVGRNWEEALDNLSKKIVSSKALVSAAGFAAVKAAEPSPQAKGPTSGTSASSAPNASGVEPYESLPERSKPAPDYVEKKFKCRPTCDGGCGDVRCAP